MTWRPTKYLLDGELDNRTPGRVTGWLRLAGLRGKVSIDLNGDFHPDIRGARILLRGAYEGADPEAVNYMEGFALQQTGTAGHMTAGLPPCDWTDYPYFEWHSTANDRVVLAPARHEIRIQRPGAPGDDEIREQRRPRATRARGHSRKVPVTAVLAQPSSTNA